MHAYLQCASAAYACSQHSSMPSASHVVQCAHISHCAWPAWLRTARETAHQHAYYVRMRMQLGNTFSAVPAFAAVADHAIACRVPAACKRFL